MRKEGEGEEGEEDNLPKEEEWWWLCGDLG
jgi:hypothetical protein